jgi:hypothetical protein
MNKILAEPEKKERHNNFIAQHRALADMQYLR